MVCVFYRTFQLQFLLDGKAGLSGAESLGKKSFLWYHHYTELVNCKFYSGNVSRDNNWSFW